ncbi:PTS sugar transporter subunit IIA [Herbidospora daliensis]|uniref:PTS sugar transporter subunit IIA n=1 Tax=Herbidospora daliensis TaxID=295585 RepID=UPI000785D89F|nr:PTS glucose transporter subunit IIA [Herbidospora daliensis]
MTTVHSPVNGRAVGLPAVPDPVFSQAMVGPGAAVDPARGPQVAVAPIAGRLVKLHPHAYIVVGDDGRGVLTHLGVDTVKLRGAGFELLAVEGDLVTAGQPVVAWHPRAVDEEGYSPVCPVIALDAGPESVSGVVSGPVEAGDPLFDWH